ncbi:MAG: tetratricopeptide repeat protein [Minicystis sp.]
MPPPPSHHPRSQRTRFIGRDRDLADLGARLGAASPVVVLGAPGIGKTRLAREYAARRGAEYPGGTWMVDLSDAAGVGGICAALGAALEVPVIGETDAAMVERLADAIAACGRVLVILDNFEHLVPHAAATVGVIRQRAPEARLLVTSRERLRLSGELLFDLGPLSLPGAHGDPAASDAVLLFADRARMLARDYALTDHEIAQAAALVQKLEGNPLAIELVTARLRVLTTAELLDSLSRSIEAYARNAADAPSRHASLAEAIAWSWGLLKPWEQRALAQCAVFQGGFDARAAVEVLDLAPHHGAPPLLEILQELRDKSLLMREDPAEREAGIGPALASRGPRRARFRLHVGVREFAAAALEAAGGVADTEARHRRYFLREARRWQTAMDGPDGIEARRDVVVETENLLAAHRRAVRNAAAEEAMEIALVLRPVLAVRGPLPLLLGVLDDALGAGEASPRLVAQALEARAEALRLLSRDHAALDARAALDAAERTGDAELIGRALLTLSVTHYVRGRLAEVKQIAARARGLGVPFVEGRALTRLGVVLGVTGDEDGALRVLEEALRISRDVGDLVGEAHITLNLSHFESERGRLDAADILCERGRALCRALGDHLREGVFINNQAVIEQARGRLVEAERLYLEAVRMLRGVGDRRHECLALDGLGTLYEITDRPREARACYEAGRAHLAGTGSREEHAILGHLGRLSAREDQIEEARVHLEAAEKIEVPASARAAIEIYRAHLDLALARRALAGGDGDAAARHEESARRRAAGVRAGQHLTEARLPLEVLARELAAFEQRRSAEARDAAALIVHPFGDWIRLPSGERVDLERRPVLSRLLVALMAQRLAAPDAPVAAEALIAAAWPGERVIASAAAARLYVSVSTLRKIGLRDLLLKRRRGYLLDPAVPARFSGPGDAARDP